MQRPAHPIMLKRLDLRAHAEEVHRLHDVTGIPIDQLTRMTLAGRFPGLTLLAGSVVADEARDPGEAQCPHCENKAGLASLLSMAPLCGRCGRLLDDGTGYTEKDVDPYLERLQHAVVEQAQNAATFTELKERIERLRPTVRHDWPTPPAHEPIARRQHALELLAANPRATNPAVLAILLARALDPAVESDPVVLARHNTGWWPRVEDLQPEPLSDPSDEVQRLHMTIRALGVEVRHIPLAITLGEQIPLIHPRDQTHRQAWARTLREQVTAATGIRSTLRAQILGPCRRWPMDDNWTVRLLTNTVAALNREGLLDRDRAVETFKHRTSIPPHVLRKLPHAAREVPNANQAAAAWLWLMTTGAGTLRVRHRDLRGAQKLIPRFHDALTAEGRLVLLEYGLGELDASAADIAALAGGHGRLENGLARDAG